MLSSISWGTFLLILVVCLVVFNVAVELFYKGGGLSATSSRDKQQKFSEAPVDFSTLVDDEDEATLSDPSDEEDGGMEADAATAEDSIDETPPESNYETPELVEEDNDSSQDAGLPDDGTPEENPFTPDDYDTLTDDVRDALFQSPEWVTDNNLPEESGTFEFPALYDDKSRIGSEDDDLILGQYEEVDEDLLSEDERQRLALSDMVLDACDGLDIADTFEGDLADVMDQLRQAETDFDRKQDGVGETPSEPEPEPEAAEAEYTDDDDEPDFLNAGGDDFSDGFTPIEGGDEPDFGEKEDDL